MKLRITITGPKVHDIGYRYLLLGGAMSLRLPGFDANNFADGKSQIVDVVVEGKEPQIAAFKKFIESNKPDNAVVSDITTFDYDGDVMRTAEYSQIITALQLLKAIPAVLEIQKNTALIPEIAENIKTLTDGQKTLIDGQETILGEIQGLHEDFTQNINRKLEGIESDMQTVKRKLRIG